jgi:hypothetical protein
VWLPDSSPAPGAVVTLLPADGSPRIATADAHGRYEFALLAPGAYGLRAHGEGGAPGRQELVLLAGEARVLDLALEPGGSIEARVVDHRGRAVAGATLVFRSDAGVVPPRRPERTGADGAARRDDLPAGTIRVRARDPQGRVTEVPVLVRTGETTAVTLVLEGG